MAGNLLYFDFDFFLPSTTRPIVFIEISIGEKQADSIKMELDSDIAPKVVQNVNGSLKSRPDAISVRCPLGCECLVTRLLKIGYIIDFGHRRKLQTALHWSILV